MNTAGEEAGEYEIHSEEILGLEEAAGDFGGSATPSVGAEPDVADADPAVTVADADPAVTELTALELEAKRTELQKRIEQSHLERDELLGRKQALELRARRDALEERKLRLEEAKVEEEEQRLKQETLARELLTTAGLKEAGMPFPPVTNRRLDIHARPHAKDDDALKDGESVKGFAGVRFGASAEEEYSARDARPHHRIEHVQLFSHMSFLILGKLGTTQLSQTLSSTLGERVASTSLGKQSSHICLSCY
jgi:hypothetical protein